QHLAARRLLGGSRGRRPRPLPADARLKLRPPEGHPRHGGAARAHLCRPVLVGQAFAGCIKCQRLGCMCFWWGFLWGFLCILVWTLCTLWQRRTHLPPTFTLWTE